jgi:hypothetical protein
MPNQAKGWLTAPYTALGFLYNYLGSFNANRAFQGHDEEEDTLCQGVNDLDKDLEKLRSMTNFFYIIITC